MSRPPLPGALLALALCHAAPAAAQAIAPPGGMPGTPTAPGTPAPAAPQAEAAAAPQVTRFAPFLALEERWSDNYNLATPETARSGWVTDVTPGLTFVRAGTRLKANVEARIHRLVYPGATGLDETQRYLDARGSLVAVENFLQLDAAAQRTQQLRSQFGPAVSPDGASASTNRVETSLWQVSPSVYGELRGWAAYTARFIASEVSTADDFVPASRVSEYTLQLRNPSPYGRFGWAVDGSSLALRNDTVGTRDNARLRASLLAEIAPQFMVSASYGRDRTEFTGQGRIDASTSGVGVAWYPTVRTQLVGEYERRFFGRGHNLTFAHRTAFTAWRVRAGRDVRVGGQLLQRSSGPAALFYDILTTALPDRETRAQAARRRLDESGIPALTIIDTGFLSDRPSLVRDFEASAAYTGPRSTASVAYTRRDQQPLGTTAATPPAPFELDLALSGYTATFSHRLTQLTTLSVSRTSTRIVGAAPAEPRARNRVTSVGLATRLGPKTTASIGLRRTDFDSDLASDFTENAFVIAIGYRP